jgi:hypothetical protein
MQITDAGLGGLLGKLGGGGLLDDVLAPQPTDVNRGNDVLGHIFRSKDVSRTVAQDAASKTGLSPDLLKKMLAMLVAGFMAKQKGAGGAPSAAAPAPASAGGIGGTLGGLLGGGAAGAQRAGGLASMLDMDGNGNAFDDILRIAGKSMR